MPNTDIRQPAPLVDWSHMIQEIDRALSQAAAEAAGRAVMEPVHDQRGNVELDQRIVRTESLLKGFDDCLNLVQSRVGQCDLALEKKENAVGEWLNSVRSIRQTLAAWNGSDGTC
jgi:hypothetical protein